MVVGSESGLHSKQERDTSLRSFRAKAECIACDRMHSLWVSQKVRVHYSERGSFLTSCAATMWSSLLCWRYEDGGRIAFWLFVFAGLQRNPHYKKRLKPLSHPFFLHQHLPLLLFCKNRRREDLYLNLYPFTLSHLFYLLQTEKHNSAVSRSRRVYITTSTAPFIKIAVKHNPKNPISC